MPRGITYFTSFHILSPESLANIEKCRTNILGQCSSFMLWRGIVLAGAHHFIAKSEGSKVAHIFCSTCRVLTVAQTSCSYGLLRTKRCPKRYHYMILRFLRFLPPRSGFPMSPEGAIQARGLSVYWSKWVPQ